MLRVRAYRSILLMFTGVALVTVVLLAAVANNIAFNELRIEATLVEGKPIPAVEEDKIGGAWKPKLLQSDRENLFPVEYALFALVITVIWLAFSERGRQTIFVIVCSAFLIWVGAVLVEDEGIIIKRTGQVADESVVQEIVLLSADWLAWGVAVVASLALLSALYFVWRRWFYRPPEEDDEFAAVAQNALAELDAGASLEDVIRWSYEAMQTAVRNRRQLNRRAGMTVREFEESLVANRLPADAVSSLTRLFEQVRYGAYTAAPDDEQVARSALKAIVVACGGTV